MKQNKTVSTNQCEEPIRCLFVGDEACYERAQIQHEFCEGQQEPISYPIHVPVNTGYIVPEIWYFAQAILFVVGVFFVVKGLTTRK